MSYVNTTTTREGRTICNSYEERITTGTGRARGAGGWTKWDVRPAGSAPGGARYYFYKQKVSEGRKGRGNEVGNEQNTCLPRTPPPRMTREQSLKIELASIRANTLSSGIREKTESEGREGGGRSGAANKFRQSPLSPSLTCPLSSS